MSDEQILVAVGADSYPQLIHAERVWFSEDAIREAIRLASEPQWVSVSDKLPEIGEKVLVVMKWIDEVLPAFLKDDKLWKVDLHPGWHEASENDIYAGSILTDVTHWMPLPKPLPHE